MWKSIKEFFGFYESKPEVNSQITDSVTQVKEPPKCGCGRSPNGNCVGLHKMTEEEWAVSNKNPNKVDTTAVVESKPTKKTAAKKTTVKTTTTAKKPRAKKANASK